MPRVAVYRLFLSTHIRAASRGTHLQSKQTLLVLMLIGILGGQSGDGTAATGVGTHHGTLLACNGFVIATIAHRPQALPATPFARHHTSKLFVVLKVFGFQELPAAHGTFHHAFGTAIVQML
jgi:hypothetical protein